MEASGGIDEFGQRNAGRMPALPGKTKSPEENWPITARSSAFGATATGDRSRSKNWSLAVFQNFTSGVVAASSHDSAARMGRCAAKVEALYRGSVVGVTWQRAHKSEAG